MKALNLLLFAFLALISCIIPFFCNLVFALQIMTTFELTLLLSIYKMNIILFDGICNLCGNSVLLLIKYDKNNIFHFAAMQTKAGERIIQEYQILNDRSSIILIKEGVVLYKSDAIIEIAKQITGWPSILKYGFFFPKFLRHVSVSEQYDNFLRLANFFRQVCDLTMTTFRHL